MLSRVPQEGDRHPQPGLWDPIMGLTGSSGVSSSLIPNLLGLGVRGGQVLQVRGPLEPDPTLARVATATDGLVQPPDGLVPVERATLAGASLSSLFATLSPNRAWPLGAPVVALLRLEHPGAPTRLITKTPDWRV